MGLWRAVNRKKGLRGERNSRGCPLPVGGGGATTQNAHPPKKTRRPSQHLIAMHADLPLDGPDGGVLRVWLFRDVADVG
jgi:hypothetical protein